MESTKKSIFYQCPNNCKDTWFYQNGTVETARKLTDSGVTIEDDHYDFNPTGPVKCYKCEAEAIVGTKTVRTTTTIE